MAQGFPFGFLSVTGRCCRRFISLVVSKMGQFQPTAL